MKFVTYVHAFHNSKYYLIYESCILALLLYSSRYSIMFKSRSFMLGQARKLESSSNCCVWEIKCVVILKKENLWDVVTKLVLSIGLSKGQKNTFVMILTLAMKNNLLKYMQTKNHLKYGKFFEKCLT